MMSQNPINKFPSIDGLIARYSARGLSNEQMSQNPILKDLSGNGHDITLHNFAWTEESGISTVNYPNALVSDGVDDYGICENFPILTKEKGYTVVAVRKWLNIDNPSSPRGCLVSNIKTWAQDGAFAFEHFSKGSNAVHKMCQSFGTDTIVNFVDSDFTYSTSNYYNGVTELKERALSGSDTIRLFSINQYLTNVSSIALYDLLIYDHDLTEEEIGKLKRWLMYQQEHPEDTTSDWYGVEWYTDDPQSSVRRIGNVNLHKSLPIQSGMYRCLLNDNGEEVYKLDPNDSTKKEDGTAAVLDGTDGQVMVYIPVFYAKFETQGYRRRVMLSSRSKSGFKKMGGCYFSAYEAAIDRTTSDTPKLASVVNTTANFRGGNNNAGWDNTYRSLLGMPATAISLTNFRAYARNRNNGDTQWNCMDYTAYKAIYWLYIVEYANRNCQLDFNDALTAEGYRQGGLGAGVTNINGSKWDTFNGYYPFIKCGYTNSLGNKTGVVAFTMPSEYDAKNPLTTYVPSYRGIENPFGHIWKWTDGIHVKVQSEEAGGKSILYTSDNPANYQDTDYDGYEEKGEIARANGYVKKILFGEDGDIITSKDGNTGGSATTYFCDYFYTSIPSSGEVLRGVMLSGIAQIGAYAGFASARTYNSPSATHSYLGSRLCYIPNNNKN